jgi:hypothetical protein
VLRRISHADPSPLQHAKQWATGQWHQPLLHTSRHNTNPSTNSVNQSHTERHTVRTPQMVILIKSFLFYFKNFWLVYYTVCNYTTYLITDACSHNTALFSERIWWQTRYVSRFLSPLHGTSSGCRWKNDIWCGEWLWIYWISSHGQLTRGGTPA